MITPIETTYKGCRFRSRLEARWAVFFDTLGITWKYEPQGYTVGPSKRPYLPDFYIPEWQAFVEVKGEAGRLDVDLLAELVATGDALSVLILGDVPYLEAGHIPLHSMFAPAFDIRTEPAMVPLINAGFTALEALDDSKKSDVRALLDHYRRMTVVHQNFAFMANKRTCFPLPVGPMHPAATAEAIVSPPTLWAVMPMPRVRDAYNAARMARFEHGEAPAA